MSDLAVVPGSLRSLLETALQELARRDPNPTVAFKAAEQLKQVVQNDIPAVLRSRLGVSWDIRGSIGLGGMMADVPWVGIFRESDASAQSGVYLVYLFAADGSHAYLVLGIGTEKLYGGPAAMHKRAFDVRAAAGSQTGLALDIDLRSSNTRPRRYEAATAYAIDYESGSVCSA